MSHLQIELKVEIDRVALDMGYKSLKSKQKQAVMFFSTQPRHAALLPTRFGNSLCLCYCICVVIRVTIQLP